MRRHHSEKVGTLGREGADGLIVLQIQDGEKPSLVDDRNTEDRPRDVLANVFVAGKEIIVRSVVQDHLALGAGDVVDDGLGHLLAGGDGKVRKIDVVLSVRHGRDHQLVVPLQNKDALFGTGALDDDRHHFQEELLQDDFA